MSDWKEKQKESGDEWEDYSAVSGWKVQPVVEAEKTI